MDDRFNTIAGWLLGGGIVLLGASLVTGEFFKAERPETMGYPIPGVVEEDHGGGGAEAELPIAARLQTADLGRGEAAFARCRGCHTTNQGGANVNGPNLFGTVGANIAHVGGYAYSDALRSHGGQWTWENMDAWLKSPRNFAEGTKMGFAGISDAQERANLIAWLNTQGSNLPLPPPPAAEAPAEGDGNAASPAENAAEASDAPAHGGETPPANAH